MLSGGAEPREMFGLGSDWWRLVRCGCRSEARRMTARSARGGRSDGALRSRVAREPCHHQMSPATRGRRGIGLTEQVAIVGARGLGVTHGWAGSGGKHGAARSESSALLFGALFSGQTLPRSLSTPTSPLILPQDIHQLKAGFPALF